ncbi:hypothetical protein FMN50_09710 [Rhodobacterales bacterium]|nr:hypothetical protein FMN50_09710 [Rhodobacterales bacterium]
MSIQWILPALAALLYTGTSALADSETIPDGDIYIISRDDADMFRGSHRIYSRKSDGLVEVTYCGRPYYVRYATIAWTQLEVEQENVVRIEHNWGKGWRPICDHPEQQVTLVDLGINEDPRIVMHNNGPTVSKVNRFAAIRKSFSTVSGDRAARSYHDK